MEYNVGDWVIYDETFLVERGIYFGKIERIENGGIHLTCFKHDGEIIQEGFFADEKEIICKI